MTPGCVANFAQEVRKEPLPFLEHVHELDPSQRRLCGVERFKPQHRTRHPLDRPMILLYDIVEIFALADDDRGAMPGIAAPDRGRIGLTAR